MNQSFFEAVKTLIPSIPIADRKVLMALAQSPDQAASASELCQVLKLTAVVQVNGAMGRIGRKLHTAFGMHPYGFLPGEFQCWHMIATGVATDDRGFVWKLRDEVVAGLIECGYSIQSGTAADQLKKRTPQFWTVHWQNSLWKPRANVEGKPIQASGSGVFEARGVAPGDVLYIISLSEGQLLLGGRMVVSTIVSRDAACRMLGTDNLFETDQWAINIDGGSPLHLHRRLAPDVSKKLLFTRTNGKRGLTFIDELNLDNQATRGISKLTDESARLLDSIIDLTDSMTPTTDMLTVSAELILGSIRSVIKLTPLPGVEPTILTASIFEGFVNTITVTVRERSREARDGCIKKHGWNCAVCDVNFERLYGQIGKEFIHVHHIDPLANSNEIRKVDPTTDLVPICPNCHAMVHRRYPPLSVAELSALLAEQRSKI